MILGDQQGSYPQSINENSEGQTDLGSNPEQQPDTRPAIKPL